VGRRSNWESGGSVINRLRDWKARFDLSHTRAWYTGWSIAGPVIVGLLGGLLLALIVMMVVGVIGTR
jgi:hypothetical protein